MEHTTTNFLSKGLSLTSISHVKEYLTFGQWESLLYKSSGTSFHYVSLGVSSILIAQERGIVFFSSSSGISKHLQAKDTYRMVKE